MVSYLNEKAAAGKEIKYVRFERKMIDYGNEDVFQFNNLQELIKFLNLNTFSLP